VNGPIARLLESRHAGDEYCAPMTVIGNSSPPEHPWWMLGRRTLCVVTWLAWLVATPASSEAQVNTPGAQAPAALTYTAAVQRALSANPRIIAARLRRPIALASRDVAAERVNPEFRVELAKETPKEAYTI